MKLNTLKYASIYVCAIILQVGVKDISTFEDMLDKGLTIALLLIGIAILLKMYKEAQNKNTKRDRDYEELLERTVKALENSNNAIKKLTDRIDNNV